MSGRGWILILLLMLAIGGGVLGMRRLEGEPPTLTAPESLLVGIEPREFEIELADSGSGLRSVRVVLVHPQGELPLAGEDLPGSNLRGAARGTAPTRLAFTIDPGALPKGTDEALLRVVARDYSWRDLLRGNEARIDIPLRIDREPPRVGVETGLTYVKRGGAGVVIYRVGEETARDGVRVGEAFFPGHAFEGRRIAFYAIPADVEADPTIRVEAMDAAGNLGKASWPVVVKERAMPQANVTLPESFLQDKVEELARGEGYDLSDRAAAFHRINTELRAANEARIREALADTAPERLWQGAFLQLPNSQVTSRFAEKRTYFVGSAPVSNATHFGYDLASTSAAPVMVAASGRVVFAEPLGIYGDCVLVDHGLGIGTLYGHLSRIDVKNGDRVERGQVLGLTGATGLAGGDHLHFAVLVGDFYVDPLEWWDPKWVGENVEARLGP